MALVSETSDSALLDLFRTGGPKGVTELAEATGVTATAVRQRLNRMMGEGLIERNVERAGRGRPSHKYSITDKGLRRSGTNYDSLAIALWKEVRAIKDPEVRRGLLARLVSSLSEGYADRIEGDNLEEKMKSLSGIMGESSIPFQVDSSSGGLPVLTALACPYPGLAEQDHSICAMERMLFGELLGQTVHLTACRLDGDSCCTFEAN